MWHKKTAAFWDVAPCGLVETDFSEVLTASIINSAPPKNVGNFLQDYTVQHPSRQSSSDIVVYRLLPCSLVVVTSVRNINLQKAHFNPKPKNIFLCSITYSKDMDHLISRYSHILHQNLHVISLLTMIFWVLKLKTEVMFV